MNSYDPFIALMVGLVVLGVLWYLFRPEKGIFWVMKYALQRSKRELVEDALKHIYDCEYKGVPCTLQSLSGTLGITPNRASGLMQHLESLGLVVSFGQGIELTDEGRSYALKIIRLHRLWERYLADETSVPEQEWHAHAEQQEHLLSSQEAEELARRMGNPRYDPHGDPIPTASGEIPPARGISLRDLPRGALAEIVHIEDEPPVVYEQLVAQGVYPGMKVRVLEVTPKRIHLILNEDEEIYLAPIVAANVTVHPIEEPKVHSEKKGIPLTQLKPGEKGRVLWISSACRGAQRRRLMDLGLIPGTIVQVEFTGASGEPVAYNIRGATIALRTDQSDLIYVAPISQTIEVEHEV
ncbi:MAG: hypothetical protein D6748_04315 [Calditrichaeota bacterium]|nr:MAG: hypothetical protein D6748_04315 [Calditrichota bacterium]